MALWASVRPEAVVLDMRMPGLSGLDVARQMASVRTSEDHEHTAG
jgi:CheY-like chemotaxis protein